MAKERSVAPKVPEAAVFGKTLERLRTERGLTQEKLAHAASLSTNYVSDIERGMTVVSLTTILKLSAGLGCSPSDLLGDFTTATIRRALRNSSGGMK